MAEWEDEDDNIEWGEDEFSINEASSSFGENQVTVIVEGTMEKAIEEVFSSEASYLADLKLIEDVYRKDLTSRGILEKHQIDLLFSNLSQLIEISGKLVIPSMENVRDLSSLKVFKINLGLIDEAFSQFCKGYELSCKTYDLLLKENERFREFILGANRRLIGRTGSWDLPSLLIKPLQRILKYPILFRQILKKLDQKETTENPMVEDILLMASSFESIATNINNIKKRRDITNSKASSKSHFKGIGLNRKLHRTTQQFKEVIGIDEIKTDEDFSVVVEEFNGIEMAVTNYKNDILLSHKSVKSMLQEFLKLLKSLAFARNRDLEYNKKIISSLEKELLDLNIGKWKEKIKEKLWPNIERMENIVKTTRELIKKRERKRLDFDRVQVMRERNEAPIDKSLLDSLDVYEALNSQLKEELPILCRKVKDYMSMLYFLWKEIEANLHENIYGSLQASFGSFGLSSNDEKLDSLISRLESLAIVHGKGRSVNRPKLARNTSITAPHRPENHPPTRMKIDPKKPQKTLNLLDAPVEDDLADWSILNPRLESSFKCKCLFSFKASRADELSLSKGNQYLVLETNSKDTGWWYGKCLVTGKSGLFPSNYVQK